MYWKLAAASVGGFVVGVTVQLKYDKYRINKAVPLILNALENALNKALIEGVTEEELKEIVKKETEFIKIAMNNRSQKLH